MNEERFRIPFRCGGGEEWTARLELGGGKYWFAAFEQLEKKVESSRPETKESFGRRLQELLARPAPLAPQQSAELITRQQPGKLTDQDISDFGFECPSCQNADVLLCPECTKYFCGGGARDSAGRFQCPWCGTTLVMTSGRYEVEETKTPTEIEGTIPRTEVRYRELPPGDRDAAR